MRRLGTRHRAVSILNFSSDGWDLPVHLRKDPAIDPFVIPSTFQAIVSPPKDVVSVWLSIDGDLKHVVDFPSSRKNLVLPSEVPSLPNNLTTARTSHVVFEDGHHFVIHDTWNAPKANRSLDQPWTGAVVFTTLSGADNNLDPDRMQVRFADSVDSSNRNASEPSFSPPLPKGVLPQTGPALHNGCNKTKSLQVAVEATTVQDEVHSKISKQPSTIAMPMTKSILPSQDPNCGKGVEVFDMSSCDDLISVDVAKEDDITKAYHARLKAFLGNTSNLMS